MSICREHAELQISRYLKLVDARPDLFPMKSNIVIDANVLVEYALANDKKLGLVYESPWHYLLVDLLSDANGRPLYAYERYVSRAEGCGGVIVPLFPDGKVCLLDHYRHTTGRPMLEFPRGFAEDGESGWEAAVRELAEELGAKANTVKILGHVIADSGVNGDDVTIILAEVSSYELGGAEPEEHINGAKLLTLDELDELIASGAITDGFTLSARGMLAAR